MLLAADLHVQVVSPSLVVVFYFPLKLDHFLAVVVSVAGLVVSLFPPAVVLVADSPLLLTVLFDLFPLFEWLIIESLLNYVYPEQF